MKNILTVRNLVKTYKNVAAVNDISFEVKEGSLFAFLGENGAGKSTTINILCTILKKNSGKIFIDGIDLDSSADQIKNIIGIVFQSSVLDGVLTVEQNLLSRCKFYGMNKKESKERLEVLSNTLELGNILKQRYDTLSGGQRRRVDIARGLINKPKLLFLDEPTTGLDPNTRKLVWDIINKLRRSLNLTVFLTTHYMEEVVEADEVVILDHGKIVAHDTPNNLKSRYSSNHFLWHINRDSKNDALLEKYHLKYEYVFDTYKVSYQNNKEIIDFISNERNVITDYEIIKGNMDDVFIEVTGRKIVE